MSTRLTRRGAVWHITGTVRCGKASRRLRETTGCEDKGLAEAVRRRRELEVERELLGIAATTKPAPLFAEVAQSYVELTPHLGAQDRAKVAAIAEWLGPLPIAEVDGQCWATVATRHLPGRKPETIRRWRAMFMAVLHHGASLHGLAVPRVPAPRATVPGSVYLDPEAQERLLAAYAPHVRPIALVLCFQGCRIAEALGLTWADVDLERDTLRFTKTKNGHGRTVPLHARVRAVLTALKPAAVGRVFVTPCGAPYRDRSDGGSGIRNAHLGACRRAGVVGFRIHDWRHHWASWMMMRGGRESELMELGGWLDPRMVKRYASLSIEHLRAAVNRL